MIRVEPLTQAWAQALARGDDVFSQQFGVPVEADWAGFPEVISFIDEVARAGAPGQWGLHLVFDHDGALVGNAGWKGEPVDGVAELGYAVATERQGRGVATAVVRELLARTAGLREVIAHTRAEVSPSTSVLTRCGFLKVDESPGPRRRARLAVEGLGRRRLICGPRRLESFPASEVPQPATGATSPPT